MTTTKTDIVAHRDKNLRFKKDLNAIILAHNYQQPDVQNIADLAVPCPSQKALSRSYPSGK